MSSVLLGTQIPVEFYSNINFDIQERSPAPNRIQDVLFQHSIFFFVFFSDADEGSLYPQCTAKQPRKRKEPSLPAVPASFLCSVQFHSCISQMSS